MKLEMQRIYTTHIVADLVVHPDPVICGEERISDGCEKAEPEKVWGTHDASHCLLRHSMYAIYAYTLTSKTTPTDGHICQSHVCLG